MNTHIQTYIYAHTKKYSIINKRLLFFVGAWIFLSIDSENSHDQQQFALLAMIPREDNAQEILSISGKVNKELQCKSGSHSNQLQFR